MINGNTSLEEDTELRDLVVQTLENNGVLAKVRAELRASVFLTLEEQESVLNPEPFLNKSVKQYLSSSEGKLLFSLVREFLEYFGLDYTISVYDPETYFGKEYNYSGRKKLCEELGISSGEPLLGEILKNTISNALNNSRKNDSSNIKLDKVNESAENFANITFDISNPKVLQKDLTSVSVEDSEKLENISNSNLEIPINVTITDKKQKEHLVNEEAANSSICDVIKSSANKTCNKNVQIFKQNCVPSDNTTDQNNKLTNEIDLSTNDSTLLTTQLEIHQNQEIYKNKSTRIELQTMNNVKNKKQIEPIKNIGSTVYFDERIVDGVKEKIVGSRNSELLLGELPPLMSINNSVLNDLPPLNGKKANMNDLKELMDIAQSVSQYEEDYASSASGSANEQSPRKVHIKSKTPLKIQTNKQEFVQNIPSENESKDIDKEIPSNISGFDNLTEKNTENVTLTSTTEYTK